MSVSLNDFEARKAKYKQQREAVRRQAALVQAANASKSSLSENLRRPQMHSPSSALPIAGSIVSSTKTPLPLKLRKTPMGSKGFLERMIDQHALTLEHKEEHDVSTGRSISLEGRPQSSSGSSSHRSKPGSKSGADIESSNLIASMASRLSSLEHARKDLRQNLIDMEKKVLHLQQENHRLKTSNMIELAPNQNECNEYSELNFLRQENAEMKRFLQDYGLEWVGDDSNSTSKHSSVNFDSLIQSLKELNSLAGPNGIIQKSRNTNVFGLNDCRATLDLLVFQNGILTGDGTFRSFTESSGHCFIRDVEDGYFPSEFKASHPSGVAFAVQDRRGEIYNTSTKLFIPGQVGVRKLGQKELMDKVPKYVIRAGEILRPRQSMEEYFKSTSAKGHTEEPQIGKISCLRRQKGTDNEAFLTICSLCEPHNVTLMVHFTASKNKQSQTCTIKMNSQETVKTAYQLLCSAVPELGYGSFTLRSAMPSERGRDYPISSNLTVDEAKWAPNAALYVKSISQSGTK